MRIETVEIKIYKFEELTGKAKEAAKEKLREWMRDNDAFYEDLMIRLNEIFPNSEMQVQYSLSFCQGDGLNVYGKMHIKDAVNFVLEKAGNEFTQQQKRFFKFLSQEGFYIKFDSNFHYCYYINKENDIQYEIEDDLEQQYFRSIPYKLIEKFSEKLDSLLAEMCKTWENDGYSYFYDYSDEDAQEDAENNGYEFTVDGKIY